MACRYGFATIIFAFGLIGTPCTASIVVSTDGQMRIDAEAEVNGTDARYFHQQHDPDMDSFTGTPTALSVSGSARVTNGGATASIAVDGRSDWSSPDHGTLDLNAIASLYQISDYEFNGFYAQGDANPWYYSFTPNVDAIFSFSVTGSDSYNGNQAGFTYRFKVNNVIHEYYCCESDSFMLTAGTAYSISFLSSFLGDGRNAGAQDYIRIITRHMEFNITAAPTPPTMPGGSAMPEPDTWALMIAGFGLIGAALRQRTPISADARDMGKRRRRAYAPIHPACIDALGNPRLA